MGFGSNEAVMHGEDEFREQCAQLIANVAAKLVAARDMGRTAAIAQASEWLRKVQFAHDDPTGTIAANNAFPDPSDEASRAQVKAIAAELLAAARASAATL